MTAGRGLDIVLFDDFAPHGGAPRVLANMIPYWVDAGFRVGLVGYRKGVCFYPEEMRDWVTFRNLGTRGKWTTAFALWRFLRRERPRVILGSSHLGNTILARLGSLPSTGTRRFGGVHNTYGQSNRRDPRKKRKKLEKVLRLYPKLDGVITVSEGSRKDLVENVGLDNVPVYAIPNGVVTPQTEAKGEMAVDHPWLRADRGEPVIITVGRLAPQKEQRTLIEAVAELNAKQACRLIILGEGPLREELTQRAEDLGIADKLDLPGFVDNPYAWMSKADCFALSSRWEGLPTVLIEAMALGVPVVSTDCPSGPAQILAGGRYGKLVPMGDSHALAEALGRTLSGQGGQFDVEEAVRDYTGETAANRYLETFGLGGGNEGPPGSQ